ncbi:MAG: cytochrome c [Deltaproteobacteria bacterium]|nr:cytochrome c [Deltaproteobacteria bacterium]
MAQSKVMSPAQRILSRIGSITVAILVVALLGGAWLIGRFGSDTPVGYTDDLEHFKYGSLGSEHEFGVPYWIWRALPELFADKLPGKGWESVGFVFEKGKNLPVGMSQRRYLGFDVVWLNCAFCHAGTVRETARSEPKVYTAMPANTFDFRAFMRFLFATGEDRRFTPRNVLRQIKVIRQREGLDDLPLIDRLVLRFYGIYYMRERILTLRDRLNFLKEQPEWGPGRVDTFNPLKAYFNFPADQLAKEERIGTTDFPSIWNQGQRETLKMNLHWDGNNVSLEERNRSAAMGTGITPPTGDRRSLKRVADWLRDLAAPPYPFSINKELAAQGAPIYKRYCAECHGADGKDFRGEQVGKVVPIAQIGTDRRRLDSYTYDVAVNQNLIFAGYGEERFSHFRKTFGYANSPLDGAWLRAPYLHNGSVPTLRDLLEPSDKRPKTFYRGYDVYDQKEVGFVSDVSEENGREYFRYNTEEPGNSNQGHEGKRYGTELSAAEKDALVEYLKTF